MRFCRDVWTRRRLQPCTRGTTRLRLAACQHRTPTRPWPPPLLLLLLLLPVLLLRPRRLRRLQLRWRLQKQQKLSLLLQQAARALRLQRHDM